MSTLTHILIAVAYTLVSTTVAVVIPRWFPEFGPNTGILAGGAVLLGAALLHEVFSRQESQSRVFDEVRLLRTENDDLRLSLDEARSDVTTMRSALTSLSDNQETANKNEKREVDSVGECPAAQVDGSRARIRQLDVLEPLALRRVVHDLADQHFPADGQGHGEPEGKPGEESHPTISLSRDASYCHSATPARNDDHPTILRL